MAKRKRLTPARNLATAPSPEPAADAAARPILPGAGRGAAPIARVAGESASEAALRDLAEDVRRARDEGRMVQALPLEAVDAGYLVRDRILADDAELEVLIDSLRDRGQQTPIEVVDLGAGRFGLISGWRRLTALRRLAAEDAARFGTVKALLRRPETAAEAYRAMVEENEIRVGLSYYERARIVARAAGQGVYPDVQAALSGLFAAASRAKRSKIGSFLKIHDALDDRLRFAAAIPERLGLALSRALEADAELAPRLRERLRKGAPADAAAELALLERALTGQGRGAAAKAPGQGRAAPSADGRPVEGPGGIRMQAAPGRITLTGEGVTEAFRADLAAWLAGRGGGAA
ncbi:ParB family chromosome partitioning protein [Rhodovulum iodosum]|uniref:ParB family chromosome partitioning protein n=1 Tax=Rhodovulum iodosum TaxID=68291 RepID=A0ABV3XZR7_9RHOB|nr:ParB N-terminal domain-containing protein [Rhodovulum robiginosum]RSK38890.1 nuclease [Rhodovulum robiginosum]